MLRHSNLFLEDCSKLQSKGILFPFRPGVLVARGFADLGYEEFVLLEQNKLVSIYRGNISEFSNEKEHFFRVPSIEEMRRKIYELGFDLKNLVIENNITVDVIHEDKTVGSFNEKEIDQFFLKILMELSLDL